MSELVIGRQVPPVARIPVHPDLDALVVTTNHDYRLRRRYVVRREFFSATGRLKSQVGRHGESTSCLPHGIGCE